MKLYVAGIGPGGMDELSPKARKAIEESDVVAGYGLYIELIKDITGDKEIIATGMRSEVERCKAAIDEALKGKTVTVVSSGDAGVYGMAGLCIELAENYPELEIEVIAGITAACSASAMLGAPLTHDFAAISLSDLLTDSAVIAKRLELASQAGFVLCLYNPASIKRADYLKKACEIIMKSRSPETPCGIARNIGRNGAVCEILTLANLLDARVDMLCTVVIGNDDTKVINGRLVTPRGYKY